MISQRAIERDVLEGAKQTFLAMPDWFIEVHQGCGLESQGGSVKRLISYFSTNYQCYIAEEDPKNDYCTWREFRPMEQSAIPSGRFFLAAVAKSN
jgi:hypothetical protein